MSDGEENAMNLFSLPPLPIEEELTEVLAQGGTSRVERIVSTGQTTGWYDQTEHEFVSVLQGEARLEFEDGRVKALAAGDCLVILPHEKHRVIQTSAEPPCVWLCVFWS